MTLVYVKVLGWIRVFQKLTTLHTNSVNYFVTQDKFQDAEQYWIKLQHNARWKPIQQSRQIIP